jgi:hypothetical protein
VDVWLVQREVFFLGNHWGEWLASLRAPVIDDFDDAVWIRTMSAANSRYAWLKSVEKISRIVALAHTVVAGNASPGGVGACLRQQRHGHAHVCRHRRVRAGRRTVVERYSMAGWAPVLGDLIEAAARG